MSDLPAISGSLQGPVVIPDGTVAVHLSLDGRFLLATRHPSGTATALALLDADALQSKAKASFAPIGPDDFLAFQGPPQAFFWLMDQPGLRFLCRSPLNPYLVMLASPRADLLRVTL